MTDNVIPFPGGKGAPPAPFYPRADAALLGDDTASLIAQWVAAHGMSGGGRGFFPALGESLRTRPRLLEARPDRAAFVLRLDLDHAKPPIWRRLRLASDLTLSEVHGIIQVAMGWSDSHLHQFQMGPREKDFRMLPFLTEYDLAEGDTDGIFEGDVRLDQVLADPGDRLFYEYDFGDAWHHTLKLEKVERWVADAPTAVCLAGRRACPPEDVGGIPGYKEVLDALAATSRPQDDESFAERLEWLAGFDPELFDKDEVNEALAHPTMSGLDAWRPELLLLLARAGAAGLSELGQPVVGTLATAPDDLTEAELERATQRYQTLLRTVGDSVKLTAAGYLQPRLVESVYTELDLEKGWIGKGNREDQTLPVLVLRESATALGLLRKARGTLSVTAAGRKLASDPPRMFAHIAARLPLGRDHEKDAGVLALLVTAAGHDWYHARHAAAAVFGALGWRAESMASAVYHAARPTMNVLDMLAGDDTDPAWRATVARALLARAD